MSGSSASSSSQPQVSEVAAGLARLDIRPDGPAVEDQNPQCCPIAPTGRSEVEEMIRKLRTLFDEVDRLQQNKGSLNQVELEELQESEKKVGDLLAGLKHLLEEELREEKRAQQKIQ